MGTRHALAGGAAGPITEIYRVELFRLRHYLIQKIFWSPLGARLMNWLVSVERRFDVVARGYSLMSETNGEKWVPNLMDPKPVVIDVGFHGGETTTKILSVRPEARIVAFDPSRYAVRAYEQNFATNARISFVNVALSNAPGEASFFDYENMCNSLAARKERLDEKATVYKVPVLTLDGYCAEHGIDHVNFLKIDAEGYDLNVLEGAKDMLARQDVDIFMFEFASGWAASRRYLWEAVEFVAPLPYRLFRLMNGFLCPVVYDIRNDSCTTLSTMYVGVSEKRLARGDIPVRDFTF